MKPTLKIILVIASFVFLAALLINAATYFEIADFLLQGGAGRLALGSSALAEGITAVFEGRSDNLKYLANLLTTRTFVLDYLALKKIQNKATASKILKETETKFQNSRINLEKFILSYYEKHPYYSDLRIINLEGWEIFHLKDGKIIHSFWDVSRSDLFKKISSSAGEIYQSEPMSENTAYGKTFMVSLAAPVLYGTIRHGFLTVKVDLFSLASYLAKNLVNQAAQLWLLDSGGRILVHPERNLISKNISQATQLAELKQFEKGILLGESAQEEIELSGEKYFFTYRPVGYKNWKLAVLLPQRSLLLGLSGLRIWQISILTAVFLTLVFFILKVIHQEFKVPLEELAEELKNASYEKGVKLAQKSSREIRHLFETMEEFFDDFKHRVPEPPAKTVELEAEQKKIQEKYHQVMDIALAFSELSAQPNLKKTLVHILEGLGKKLNIKSSGILLEEKESAEQIIALTHGLKEGHLSSFDELKSISYEVKFEVTPKISGTLFLNQNDLDINDFEIRDFLAKLGAKLGEVLRSALHHEEKTIAEAVVVELRQARGFKEKFFKSALPKIKGLELAEFYWPTSQVGGAFFDFLDFSEDGYLDVIFAEIPGNGLKTALGVGTLKGLLKSRAIAANSAEEIVADVNKLVFEEFSELTPISISYSMIDLQNKLVASVNVADTRTVYFSGATKQIVALKNDPLGLGAQKSLKLTVKKITLRSGDILAIFSQGFFRSFDRQLPFGADRIKNIFEKYSDRSALYIAQKLREEFLRYLGEKELPVDILALMIKVS